MGAVTHSRGRWHKLAAIASADVPLAARLSLIGIGARVTNDWRYGLGHIPVLRDADDIDWRILLGIVCDRDYDTDYSGRYIVDLGGHKGFFGAYAFMRGAASVVSYEPEATNFAALQQAAAESAGNWRTTRAAVGGADGEGRLVVSAASWTHCLGDEGEPVTVISLERVLERAVSDAAGRKILVKIDIEGAEAAALEATPVSSWQPVEQVLVDVHGTDDVALSCLRDAGFALTRQRSEVMHFSR